MIRLTDAQLHELMQTARMVPPNLRDIFLEALRLRQPMAAWRAKGLKCDAYLQAVAPINCAARPSMMAMCGAPVWRPSAK